MAIALPSLPEHDADLREYCRQLLTELTEHQQLIAKLSHEFALFRRYVYGRRSEKLNPAQLLLEFAGWLKAMNETAPAGGGGRERRATESAGAGAVSPPSRARADTVAGLSAAPARGTRAAGGAVHV